MTNQSLIARFFVTVLMTVTVASCSNAPSKSVPTGVANTVQQQAVAGSNPRSTADLVPAIVGIPQDPGPSGTHRISAGDVLTVDVFQVDEMSTEERVAENGSIVMPLIGPVAVSGLTTEQAERTIATALQKDYLQDPQVNIFVKEYANMNITVGGSVEKPGVFPLTGTTTLLQAIAQAQGVTTLANPSEVVVFRSIDGRGINAYVVDLTEIEQGRMSDPILASNDKIMVPKSGSKVFLKNLGDTLRGFVRIPVF